MSGYELTEPERAKERAFIMDANRWPLWPQLPVKRRRENAFPQCGMVEDRMDNLTAGKDEPCLPLRVKVDGSGEVLEYATADAMLADGWIVD